MKSPATWTVLTTSGCLYLLALYCIRIMTAGAYAPSDGPDLSAVTMPIYTALVLITAYVVGHLADGLIRAFLHPVFDWAILAFNGAWKMVTKSRKAPSFRLRLTPDGVGFSEKYLQAMGSKSEGLRELVGKEHRDLVMYRTLTPSILAATWAGAGFLRHSGHPSASVFWLGTLLSLCTLVTYSVQVKNFEHLVDFTREFDA